MKTKMTNREYEALITLEGHTCDDGVDPVDILCQAIRLVDEIDQGGIDDMHGNLSYLDERTTECGCHDEIHQIAVWSGKLFCLLQEMPDIDGLISSLESNAS